MGDKEQELLEAIETYNGHAGNATIKYDTVHQRIYTETYADDSGYSKNEPGTINVITKNKVSVGIHGDHPVSRGYVVEKLDEALELYRDLGR